VSHTSLALSLKLDAGAPRRTGAVTFANRGGTTLRVWRAGNSWGDSALSFEVRSGENVTRLFRREQEYTRNVPATVALPPGAEHEWPFDLDDGEWIPGAPVELNLEATQLVAVYDVPESSEAKTQDVWTGLLRSEPRESRRRRRDRQ
jgi:hypothetical protein